MTVLVEKDVFGAANELVATFARHGVENVSLRGVAEGWSVPAAIWRNLGPYEIESARADQHVLPVALAADPSVTVRRVDRSRKPGGRPGLPVFTLQRGCARDVWTCDGPMTFGHVYVRQAWLDELGASLETRCDPSLADDLYFEPDAETHRMLLDYLARSRRPEAPSPLEMDARAVLLGVRLLERYGGAAVRRSNSGGLAPWRLERAKRRLEERLAEDVSLQAVADDVGLSLYHFCRQFRASTGLPPHAWRQVRRIEHAKTLLSRREADVLSVAAAVGYDNPGHFAKLFRRHVGVSPSEFRRQL